MDKRYHKGKKIIGPKNLAASVAQDSFDCFRKCNKFSELCDQVSLINLVGTMKL